MSRYLLRGGLVLLDVACLLAAFWLGWRTRFTLMPILLPEMPSVEQPWSLYLDLLAPSALLLITFVARARLYRLADLEMRHQVYGAMQAALWLAPPILAYLVIFQQSYEFSRLGTLFALAWLLLLLPAARAVAFLVLSRSGWVRVPMLFIGRPDRVESFLKGVGRRRYMRGNLELARLDPAQLLTDDGGDFRPHADEQVNALLERGLEKVVVFMEGMPRPHLTTVLRKFEIRVRSVKLVPDAASMSLMGARIVRQDDQPLLTVEQALWRPAKRAIKRSVDLAAGILALPVVALVLLLALPFMGGRPLMRIRRYDLARRPITLLQLRVDYARGGWLFQSGLYKLPEMLGVLLGRQSLVGPAPLIPREFEQYPGDMGAFSFIKPGLTGLWQVSDYSYFEPGQRLAMDMYYAMNWSLRLDGRILLESIMKGVSSLGRPRQGGMRT